MNSFEAQILTPEGSLFDGNVKGVQMPGAKGSFEVKTLHADIISTLDIGQILVRKSDGDNQRFAVSGGFVEVHDNKLTLLAEAAEAVDEIDVERAKEAKKRAQERLNAEDSDIDRERAEKSKARAQNRIKLSVDVSVSTQ